MKERVILCERHKIGFKNATLKLKMAHAKN